MKRTLQFLPMTESMYDTIFQKEVLLDPDNYIQVDSDRWAELLADDKDYAPLKHYIYKPTKSDIIYILSQVHIFAKSDLLTYGLNTYKKLKLNSNYYYIFAYRGADKEEAMKFWTTSKGSSKEVINGLIAWNKVQAEIHNHYLDNEIEDIINEYGVEDIDTLDILHSNIINDKHLLDNTIYEFDDIRYYDLNKAYASNLMTFFPKIKDWMLDGYKKNKPYFKKVVNYAVGCMQNKTHYKKDYDEHNFHLLRNAIVTNTTLLMNEAQSELLKAGYSNIVYQNTDGFIINRPAKELDNSKEIGDWGKEQVDDNKLWMVKINQKGYQSYTIMQWFEDGKKVVKVIGGFRLDSALIDRVNLDKGTTVLFNMRPVVTAVEGVRQYYKVVDKKSMKEVALNGKKW